MYSVSARLRYRDDLQSKETFLLVKKHNSFEQAIDNSDKVFTGLLPKQDIANCQPFQTECLSPQSTHIQCTADGIIFESILYNTSDFYSWCWRFNSVRINNYALIYWNYHFHMETEGDTLFRLICFHLQKKVAKKK